MVAGRTICYDLDVIMSGSVCNSIRMKPRSGCIVYLLLVADFWVVGTLTVSMLVYCSR